MKRIIIGIVIGVAIAAGGALASGYHSIYNKGGILCMDTTSGGMKTVGCGMKDGTGYMVGINKYVVAVSDSNGKTVYRRFQP